MRRSTRRTQVVPAADVTAYTMRLSIYVFSYNRGEFLRNSVDSVERHAPAGAITVIDDLSNDPSTREALNALRGRVRVLQPDSTVRGRYGGLHINMQRALDESAADDILLFLQDDVQMVRDLTTDDLDYIDKFFSHFPSAAFLHPCFLKGGRRRRDQRIARLADEFPVYFREYPQKRNERGLSYADVVLAHAGRLQRAEWRFAPNEIKNGAIAARQFGKMGFMAHPFAMFLPEVPVTRHKYRSWGMRVAERRRGFAPKAFEAMQAAEVEQMKRRDLAILPVAEQYLRCTDGSVQRPFVYHLINLFPTLRALDRLESASRLFVRRLAERGTAFLNRARPRTQKRE